jgi:hypothetical protein
MSKFNVANRNRTQVSGPTSPIQTSARSTERTGQGAPGYTRDAKSELFLLAVTNMVSENTFYEPGKSRDERFVDLVRHVAVTEYAWFLGFVRWLRDEANMRSATVVAVVEGAKALLDAKIGGGRLLFEALSRADEPGEAFSYWLAFYGRPIPKPIKRGIADAATRLYTEFNYLKWDSERNAVRFADVIDMLRPDPRDVRQNQLFRYILDARHGHNAIADEKVHASYLPMIDFQANVRHGWATQDAAWIMSSLNPELLRRAGLTWEDVMSALGSKVDKATLWNALIPNMGYMALLRNLRNFDQAGISPLSIRKVQQKLMDPDEVRRSRQFPFRFLSAYREVPSLNWGQALETALDLSMVNVAMLPGRTLVLVDMSGSMTGRLSARSTVSRADAAAVFGTVLARRNPGGTDLVQFGTTAQKITMTYGDSILRTVTTKFRNMGGTHTQAAARQFYAGHDRVVIITDEQTQDGDPGRAIPASVPMYTWNVAGYSVGSTPSGSGNRHTFGGLNDAAFRLIPLLESSTWPWENDGPAA